MSKMFILFPCDFKKLTRLPQLIQQTAVFNTCLSRAGKSNELNKLFAISEEFYISINGIHDLCKFN